MNAPTITAGGPLATHCDTCGAPRLHDCHTRGGQTCAPHAARLKAAPPEQTITVGDLVLVTTRGQHVAWLTGIGEALSVRLWLPGRQAFASERKLPREALVSLAPEGARTAIAREGQRLEQTPKILTTQREADEWIASHVKIGECIPAAFAPVEPIDLARWIGAYACCSLCATATRGVRRGEDGRPEERCDNCGEENFLTTRWGDAQSERWEAAERTGRALDEDDDGPEVGPIIVTGGVPEHAAALLDQADREWVESEDRRPASPSPEGGHSVSDPPAIHVAGLPDLWSQSTTERGHDEPARKGW